MKSSISILAIAACFFIAAGCSSQAIEFTEKKLVIASGETVTIKELDMSITNKGCGREWYSENGKSAGERAYCELVITHGDSSLNTSARFEPLYLSEAQIKLDKINP